MSLLRRVPWWVWGALALGVVFYVQELRVASALRASDAARDAMFQNTLQQIDAQRDETARERAALGAERAAIQKDIQANKDALRSLATRSQAAAATTTKDRERAEALAAAPTFDALKASAARLGVSVKAVAR